MRNHPEGMGARLNSKSLSGPAVGEFGLGSEPDSSLRAGLPERRSPDPFAGDGECGCLESDGLSIAFERSQCADDVLDLILLKQADRGDAGRARLPARGGILQGDTAESEDGNPGLAGCVQCC